MTTGIRSNTDGSKSYIQVGGTDRVTIGSQGIEAGSFKSGAIAANDLADGALIENSVNGIGYGVGAGGTVTQPTSKSTAVTLNKPCGRITTHNASLAAGGSVSFVFNNTLISSADTVIANIYDLGTVSPDLYEVNVRTSAGACSVLLTNKDSVSRAEAVGINFAIIKGVTS